MISYDRGMPDNNIKPAMKNSDENAALKAEEKVPKKVGT